MNRSLLDRLFPFVRAELPDQVEFWLDEHGLGRCFAFTPRYGNVLAVGLHDGTIALYDLVTRSLATKLQGHTSDVFSLNFIPRSTWLLSTSLDGSLRLWDVRRARCLLCVRFEAQLARAVPHPRFYQTRLCCVSQTGQPALLVRLPSAPGEYHVTECAAAWVLSAAADRTGLAGAQQDPDQAERCAAAAALVSASAPSEPDAGQSLTTHHRVGRTARLLNEQSERGVVELPATLAGSPNVPVAYLAADFDRSGNYVVAHAAEQAGRIQVYSIEHALDSATDPFGQVQLVESFALPSRAFVKQILFAERGDRLLVVCHDRVVRVFQWEPSQPSKLRLWRELKDRVSSIQWRWAVFASQDEFLVAGTAANADHRLYVWDLNANQLMKQLEGHPKEALSMLAYHANLHALLVLTYQSGSIQVYHKTVAENWSAYAPSFREVSENVEYVEAEDEFDFDPDGSSVYDRRRRKLYAPADEDAILVDITGSLEKVDAAHDVQSRAPSSSSSLEELYCLPVEIPPDLPPVASEASWLAEFRALRRERNT
ncbi:hypothetical protein CCYA_CCYA15G4022 [Cyanidiococcus yangmingshanensis]|nr:hypothetical protein CCYA_CCYA15G4022 [Cyanidiococcus yangmingshanensis]